MSISATSATQSISPFVPGGVWLSGKPGFDSFVSREDVYGCAPAGRIPRRSGRAPPGRLNRPATPVPGPFKPLPPCVLALEPTYRVRSRLHKPRRGGASAIQNNAYSQDFGGLQSLLALPLSQDRYSAKPKDSIPTMGSLCHPPATIKVEFPHQDNDVEGSQTSTISQSTASASPDLPAQPDEPVTGENLWEQLPMTLKRSKALRYRPEDLRDAGAHVIDPSKLLSNPRLARTRAALSRLRNKLSRAQS